MLEQHNFSLFQVIAYALAGRVDIDFETEVIGQDSSGGDVFLRDIWPTRSEIQAVEREAVIPTMFQEVYRKITKGTDSWNQLEVPTGILYPWDAKSTYIRKPPFFEGMTADLPPLKRISNARVLLYLGDSVTTDHISPAGSISRQSPAARSVRVFCFSRVFLSPRSVLFAKTNLLSVSLTPFDLTWWCSFTSHRRLQKQNLSLQVPDGTWSRAARIQLVRLPTRQRRSHGSRHFCKHPLGE